MSTSKNESGIEPDFDLSLDNLSSVMLDYNYADESRVDHATKRNFRAVCKSKQPPKVQPSRDSFGPRDIDPTTPRAVSLREDSYLSPAYNSSCYKSYFDQMFETVKKIGEGSFGEVFKVRSKDDGKLYAIKKTKVRFAHKWDRRNRIEEVKRHEKIPQHDNCVQLIFSWEEHDYLYIQLELCETSLEDFTRDFLLSEPSIWLVLLDLLLAVKHLHDLNIIHLDIKLENILISFNGRCKLADFGIAMDLAKGSPTDGLEGDAKYLAPEILSNEFSKAADVFSLGVVALELATDLVVPRRGPLWHELRSDKLPDQLLDKLSHELVTVIRAMMTSAPALRPSVNTVLSSPRLATMRTTLRPSDPNQALADVLLQRSTDADVTVTPPRPGCTPPCPHASAASPRRNNSGFGAYLGQIRAFPSLTTLDDSDCKMECEEDGDASMLGCNLSPIGGCGADAPKRIINSTSNMSPIGGCGVGMPSVRIINSTPQHGRMLKASAETDASWAMNARRLFD